MVREPFQQTANGFSGAIREQLRDVKARLDEVKQDLHAGVHGVHLGKTITCCACADVGGVVVVVVVFVVAMCVAWDGGW